MRRQSCEALGGLMWQRYLQGRYFEGFWRKTLYKSTMTALLYGYDKGLLDSGKLFGGKKTCFINDLETPLELRCLTVQHKLVFLGGK